MSNQRGLAEQLPAFTSTPAETAAPVRPKVMRRPAQFTDTRPKTVAPSIVLPPSAETEENENLAISVPITANTAPATKTWQDDVRFGIVMLTIVVLVNLALMAWLPQMRPVAVPAAEPKQEASGTVTTPPDQSLTFYAKPGIALDPVSPREPQMEPRVLGGADSGPNQ